MTPLMRRRARPCCLALFASFWLLLSVNGAKAQSLAKMQHSIWAGHDDAPQGIHALAMDRNNELWIGTLSGLFTFDGRTFHRFVPDPRGASLPLSIFSLQFAPNGDLWVFGAHRPPVVIRGQIAKEEGQTDAERVHVMTQTAVDSKGTVWAVLNQHRLVHFDSDGVWHADRSSSLQGHHIENLFISRNGTQWLILDGRLFTRGVSASDFHATTTYVHGRSELCDGSVGDLWIASAGHSASKERLSHLQHVSGNGSALPAPMISAPLIYAQQALDGALWMVSAQSTLYRYAEARTGKPSLHATSQLSSLPLNTALVGNSDRILLPAPDGSMWVGGLGGVERFATPQLVPLLPSMTAGHWENCASSDGGQWVLDPHEDLSYIHEGLPTRRLLGSVGGLFCTAVGPIGEDYRGLFFLKGPGIQRLPWFPITPGSGTRYNISGVTADPHGAILALTEGNDVNPVIWRWNGIAWEKLMELDQLPAISAIKADSRNDLRLGYVDGSVGIVRDRRLVWRSSPDVGRHGAILGFAFAHGQTVIFGKQGLATWRRDAIQPIRLQNAELESGVSGAVEDLHGNLWLNGARGIVMVPAREVDLSLRDSRYKAQSDNLREGNFVGPAFTTVFSQRAQRDRRGRVWFSTLNGIVSVDPSALLPTRPPSLFLRGARADGKPIESDQELSPDVGVLNIAFTAIDYSDPYGVSYVYRLLGYDDVWREAGPLDEATFTHLKAGKYIFQVNARNARGLWAGAISMRPIVIRPHLYERRWFIGACAVILLIIAGGIGTLRLRSIELQATRVAEARASERVRIARDLHDTLLQGIQGLLLSLQVATEKISVEDKTRESLERSLARAEKLAIEGRQRVRSLRIVEIEEEALEARLLAAVGELHSSARIMVRSVYDQERFRLRNDVSSEAFMIAREALGNADQHAGATNITLTLFFRNNEFVMECRDDGVGIPLPKLRDNRVTNAWGVRGMAERAEFVGGILEIDNVLKGGLSVKLRVPSNKAYF